MINDMDYLGARPRRVRLYAAAGWLVAAAALVSPLYALSVPLFCAGVGQRLILLLVAAPLLALASPPRVPRGAAIWSSAAAFLVALWFWHIPWAYDATFTAAWIYWSMQCSLFASAILLWRELLHHPRERSPDALAAGALTFVQMALLGVMLTVADRPLFKFHTNSAQAWDMTELTDQHVGGLLICAPAVFLLVWVAARALTRLRPGGESDGTCDLPAHAPRSHARDHLAAHKTQGAATLDANPERSV